MLPQNKTKYEFRKPLFVVQFVLFHLAFELKKFCLNDIYVGKRHLSNGMLLMNMIIMINKMNKASFYIYPYD